MKEQTKKVILLILLIPVVYVLMYLLLGGFTQLIDYIYGDPFGLFELSNLHL